MRKRMKSPLVSSLQKDDVESTGFMHLRLLFIISCQLYSDNRAYISIIRLIKPVIVF